jgi:hypothetical protein
MGPSSLLVFISLGFFALVAVVCASFLFQVWSLLRLKMRQNEIRLATMKAEIAKVGDRGG